MTYNAAAKLAELGLALPAPAAPVAAYVPTVEAGGFLYVSGQVSFVDGALVKDGTGVYHVDITTATAGQWTYRWEGTGTVQQADEGSFVVEASAVT